MSNIYSEDQKKEILEYHRINGNSKTVEKYKIGLTTIYLWLDPKKAEQQRKNVKIWAAGDGKEKHIAGHTKWHEKNPEYDRLHKKDYINRNRTKWNKSENLRHHHRMATDINYRLRKVLRSRVSSTVVLRGYSKSKKTLKLLGCSVEYLREHLEKQFLPGMSWKNYGKWHIDHIIPCSSFDFTKLKEQQKCFHYTNLQPLWAEDNMLKGSKIIKDKNNE